GFAVTASVELTASNLTIVMSAINDSSQLAGTSDDLLPIMRDPLPIEVGEGRLMFASAVDQLVFEVQPPRAILRDAAGGWPARPRFASAIAGMLEFVSRYSLKVPAYGWNVDGALIGTPAQAVLKLFDEQRVTELLGGKPSTPWTPSELKVVANDVLAGGGVLTLVLYLESEEDDSPAVRFTMNAHFDRSPGIIDAHPVVHSSEVVAKGEEFFAEAKELLARLTELQGESAYDHPN
ncbi:MAG: hypothetical protein OXG27_06270, partial [Chloroflexi bacterium]|nr:hypothetical protein [Chloroflexota bacterium]